MLILRNIMLTLTTHNTNHYLKLDTNTLIWYLLVGDDMKKIWYIFKDIILSYLIMYLAVIIFLIIYILTTNNSMLLNNPNAIYKYAIIGLTISMIPITIYLYKKNYHQSKNINFKLEDATNFTGNSAIYILYNYARINSILNKSTFELNDNIVLDNALEKLIIKKLYDFKDIVKETVKTSESVIITKYLNDLCSLFSRYYEEVSILKEENITIKNSRLLLLNSIKIVIENSCTILGIKTIEKL